MMSAIRFTTAILKTRGTGHRLECGDRSVALVTYSCQHMHQLNYKLLLPRATPLRRATNL